MESVVGVIVLAIIIFIVVSVNGFTYAKRKVRLRRVPKDTMERFKGKLYLNIPNNNNKEVHETFGKLQMHVKSKLINLIKIEVLIWSICILLIIAVKGQIEITVSFTVIAIILSIFHVFSYFRNIKFYEYALIYRNVLYIQKIRYEDIVFIDSIKIFPFEGENKAKKESFVHYFYLRNGSIFSLYDSTYKNLSEAITLYKKYLVNEKGEKVF